MCIQSHRGKKGARLGDMSIGCVKEAQPRGKVKKGDVVYGVVVRAAMKKGRKDGIEVQFNDNAIVIEYCNKHVQAKPANVGASSDTASAAATPAAPAEDLKNWEAEFVKIDQTTLFDLILGHGDVGPEDGGEGQGVDRRRSLVKCLRGAADSFRHPVTQPPAKPQRESPRPAMPEDEPR
ncbi:ribosomal L14 protein [Hordeum vulgare]|nr:ribosomal L14 protein [Hordeum vulgare]